MQVEFLLEEESAEDALRQLLPRLLPVHYLPRFRVFAGWKDLLGQLPALMRGYQRRIRQPGQHDLRVVVLLDADGVSEARAAKQEEAATAAGLLTYAQAQDGQHFHVFNALAVQELEAWFLGDRNAIMAAYPKVKTHHFKGIDPMPDNPPKPSDVLLRILKEAGLFTTKRKREWAKTITPYLEPEHNKSGSFQYFRNGLSKL